MHIMKDVSEFLIPGVDKIVHLTVKGASEHYISIYVATHFIQPPICGDSAQREASSTECFSMGIASNSMYCGMRRLNVGDCLNLRLFADLCA